MRFNNNNSQVTPTNKCIFRLQQIGHGFIWGKHRIINRIRSRKLYSNVFNPAYKATVSIHGGSAVPHTKRKLLLSGQHLCVYVKRGSFNYCTQFVADYNYVSLCTVTSHIKVVMEDYIHMHMYGVSNCTRFLLPFQSVANWMHRNTISYRN